MPSVGSMVVTQDKVWVCESVAFWVEALSFAEETGSDAGGAMYGFTYMSLESPP